MNDAEKIINDIKKEIYQIKGILKVQLGQIIIEIDTTHLINILGILKEKYKFLQLIDIFGIDYLTYGKIKENKELLCKKRFSVVYNLLNMQANIRIRVKIYLDDAKHMKIPTSTKIWPSANWNEREIYDMFGIIFLGHPHLKRILTDYNFKGHPFRKDFPQSGELEINYNTKEKKLMYKKTEVDPRINTPKIIRKDNRYL